MDRNELQNKAASLLKERKRLICQWATGTGKSKVAINFIKDNQDSSTLILVPEQNNIQNWKDEFTKFNVDDGNVTIICYASLHKYIDTTWDLLVFDEVPHIDTDIRAGICKSMTAEYILALGAVISDEEKETLESVFGSFLVWTITISQAIKSGILAFPKINVLHLTLDDKKRSYYYKGRYLTAKQYYAVLHTKVDNAVANYNKQAIERNKRIMLMAGNERKKFLGKIKEDVARRICKSLTNHNKRFICFCSSIEQTKLLGDKQSFTSETPTSMKLLDKFNNKEINSLYVVGKLIEGQNLKDIDCGVIVQLGGTHRITVQEIGRILRSDSPIVYVTVFDNTKDDKFLETLTYNIPSDCIKHYNF